MVLHRQKHLKKLSSTWGDWGHATACGMTVKTDEATTTNKNITCQACLQVLITQVESQLNQLHAVLAYIKENPCP